MYLAWVMLLASSYSVILIRCSNKIISASAFTTSSKSSFFRRSSSKSPSFVRGRGRCWMTTTATAASADEALRGLVRVPVSTAVQLHSSNNNDNNNNVRFLDGSWWLGDAARGRRDFEKGPRIPGAHFFDIDDICLPAAAASAADNNPKQGQQPLPHMLPPPDLMARAMDWMGVSNEDHVVVYAQHGCPFVFRAFFQLYAMGHGLDRLHLLDGSLQDWIDAGGPVDEQPDAPTVYAKDLLSPSSAAASAAAPPSYRAAPARNVVGMDEMKRLVVADHHPKSSDDAAIIVDVRSPDRFRGRVGEPRPGLRRGHMPGSCNEFFQDLLDPDHPNRLLPRGALREKLRPLLNDGNDSNSNSSNGSRIIATCGSGATACTLAAALLDLGVDPRRVWIYDGSWAEWGADPDVPVVTTSTTEHNEQEQEK